MIVVAIVVVVVADYYCQQKVQKQFLATHQDRKPWIVEGDLQVVEEEELVVGVAAEGKMEEVVVDIGVGCYYYCYRDYCRALASCLQFGIGLLFSSDFDQR